MYLKRHIDQYLEEWHQDPDKLPLIVKGARQVGKTESIQHFAKENYDNFIEINFVRDKRFLGLTTPTGKPVGNGVNL